MTAGLLLPGLAVGALAAFPLGPVGMLCFHRAQTQGARAGLASASGIALASALWCLATVQGLGHLARHLPVSPVISHLALGLILAAVAWRSLLRPPGSTPRPVDSPRLAGHFLATFLVVLANPLTPVTVVALLTALGLGEKLLTLAAAGELALAVLAGGLLLWLVLIRLLARLRDPLAEGAASGANRILSLCAAALGCAYILSALWRSL